jgi:hypothetical protein
MNQALYAYMNNKRKMKKKKKQKCHFFLYKIGEWVLPGGGGLVPLGKEEVGKGM